MGRRYKHQGRGLSSAVILGLKQAKFDTIVSMDADLQHEPESVPDVLKPVHDPKSPVEFTIGCRYTKGGGIGFEWNLSRQIISLGATVLAYGLVPSNDPMSGFFCCNKKVLARAER